MMEIKKGSIVKARTATDEWVKRVALSGIVEGTDFPVVWVCREEDWRALQGADTFDSDAGAVPWPAEDVRVG